jgi:hypothetical protein
VGDEGEFQELFDMQSDAIGKAVGASVASDLPARLQQKPTSLRCCFWTSRPTRSNTGGLVEVDDHMTWSIITLCLFSLGSMLHTTILLARENTTAKHVRQDETRRSE